MSIFSRLFGRSSFEPESEQDRVFEETPQEQTHYVIINDYANNIETEYKDAVTFKYPVSKNELFRIELVDSTDSIIAVHYLGDSPCSVRLVPCEPD